MARIRALKPDFFTDEDLSALDFWVRILFEGLWCHADREGRLEDRPVKLKALIFPYDEVDIEEGLTILTRPKIFNPIQPFIKRYSENGQLYIQIVNFTKHQVPHTSEKASKIPPPPIDEKAPVGLPWGGIEVTPCKGSLLVEGGVKRGEKVESSTSNHHDVRLVQLLVELMLRNNPKSHIIKALTPRRRYEWETSCRLLREKDGATPEQIEAVIRFSQDDPFWKSNILSMYKLREKWDSLWLKARMISQNGQRPVSQVGFQRPAVVTEETIAKYRPIVEKEIRNSSFLQTLALEESREAWVKEKLAEWEAEQKKKIR